MAAEDANLAARLERSGLRLLSPAAGLQALGAAPVLKLKSHG